MVFKLYTSSKIYEVLIYSLQRWWNRKTSKSIQVATNKIFTNGQEGTICKYIDCLDKINIYTWQKKIVTAAKYFVCFENHVLNHK